MLYIVSYDIVEDKKRTKLAKKLCNYGNRVQYSVFECNLSKAKLKEMKKELMQFINPEKDSFRIYKLCQECVKHLESYGIKEGFEARDEAIII